MSATIDQLQREIAALKERLDAQERGAGAASTRPAYLLSDADSAKAAATRARNAELAARGGARPIGGGTDAPTAPGRISGGVRIDTLSETRQESERGNGSGLPSGYGPEAFTICDSGTPVTRNFITDNPDP